MSPLPAYAEGSLMIRILAGENTFFVQRKINEMGDEIIRYDGSKLTSRGLVDLLSAQSLFSRQRTIIIDGLLSNKEAWQRLTAVANNLQSDPDLNLILIETKPDGRDKLIKQAKKDGWFEEFQLPKNSQAAVTLLETEAVRLGLELQPNVARQIVERVGVDTWAGVLALEKLAVLGPAITLAMVEEYIAPSLEVNAFKVVDALFAHRAVEVASLVDEMERTSVNYLQFFGLIVSQVTNLLLIKVLGKTQAQTELKIHPFVANKLNDVARNFQLSVIKRMIAILSETDLRLKTTKQGEWDTIKIGLLKLLQ